MSIEKIQTRDPVKRQAEIGFEDRGLNPMAPPDAYAPPRDDSVPYEEMHPFLQGLMDEHASFIKTIETFEETLLEIQKEGIDRQRQENLKEFFIFFDDEFGPHNRQEEKLLFPVLNRALIDKGEHSRGFPRTTAVDLLEDEHITAIQLVAVVFNFFGLVARLPDPKSQLLVLDVAIEQGKSLVELLRLHIFREDQIVFSLAQRNIDPAKLDEMKSKINLKEGTNA